MRSEEIVCAGDDGRVKVWRLWQSEDEGGVGVEDGAKLEGMEKVIQVEWHPFVKGLIAVLCVDLGHYEIRLWDHTGEGYRRMPLSYPVCPIHN